MEHDQENKVMETENTKGAEVDLEKVGDKVAGGARSLKKGPFADAHLLKFEDTFDVNDRQMNVRRI